MMSGYQGSRCLFVETYRDDFSFAGTYPSARLYLYYMQQGISAFSAIVSTCRFHRLNLPQLLQNLQQLTPTHSNFPCVAHRNEVIMHIHQDVASISSQVYQDHVFDTKISVVKRPKKPSK